MKPRAFFAAATMLAAVVFVLVGLISNDVVVAQSGPKWEPVNGEIAVGKSIRLEVRLVGLEPKPQSGAVIVTSSRLDMGPEGMETMTAPLRLLANDQPGVIAFEADIAMAGRWALSLTADIAGHAAPVSGTTVFTATDRRTEATPATATAGERRIVYYRNPMGLPDVSPVPKSDPMGMAYIPVYEDEVSGPAGTIRVTPDKVQRAGIRVGTVGRHDMARTVRGFGTVEPDENRLAVLNTRFEGFVEEVFASVTGQEVRAGQPLVRVWIESRDILQKQSDLLIGLRASGDRTAESERAAKNLRLFGIPDQAIQEIRRTGEPVRSVVLTAASSGTVVEKSAVVGMRFDSGETLYRLADLSVVWIMAQFAERDLPSVRVGQQARISFRAAPGEEAEGRVAFVQPTLGLATRTATARIEMPNRDRQIRLGQYADVILEVRLTDLPVIAIPESAIIDSGSRRVAFVAKGDGTFEPRHLVLGRRGNGLVEIREGLSEGEQIVIAGNFLIDAESNLRSALATFATPGTQE